MCVSLTVFVCVCVRVCVCVCVCVIELVSECVSEWEYVCVCLCDRVCEWVTVWASVFVRVRHVENVWIYSTKDFLELHGKVDVVVRNCLLRWSGQLVDVAGTIIFDQSLFVLDIFAFLCWWEHVPDCSLLFPATAGHAAYFKWIQCASKVLYFICSKLKWIEREHFYPGPWLEPGPLACRANALTNWAIQDKYGSTIQLISQSHPFWSQNRQTASLLCPMEACILKF